MSITVNFDLGLNEEAKQFLRELFLSLMPPRTPPLNILGGELMFLLPNDQPDVPFTISPTSATDAEGEAVPLTESFVSDNEAVLSLLFAEGANASNPRVGQVHVGTSGLANLTYTATDPQGNIVRSAGGQFTITTGAIANVSGGDLVFEGITEA